jgi:DMSO/TMAO reductase YedYZ molybdopterin-dependent catalytic subunit
MTPVTVVSEDTRRDQRIPPGQVQTYKWPVLDLGHIPAFDPVTWDFSIFPKPLISENKRLTWGEFQSLPKIQVFADMHCVTRWSKLNNLWNGVATRELLKLVTLSSDVKFVMVHSDDGFSTNLSLDDFLGEDCLFAMAHDGQPLSPEHGYPLRLMIPQRYAWKSAKWVRGIELMTDDRPGYWEDHTNGGYHLRGDPWLEERHRS